MIEHTMDGLSINIEQTNLDKLRSVFPECVSEGKLDIDKLLKEYNEVVSRGVPAPKLMISERCQMVMPYHVLFDMYEEERLGKASFGSTKSGIAPFYSDKYAKIGFQVNELFDEDRLKEKLASVCETKNVLLEHLYHKPLLNVDELFAELMEYKKMVEPYVCDVSAYLHDAIKEGKILAIGENSPVKIAELGMQIAQEILVDGEDPESYDDITMTEAAAVTAENVDEHYDYGF